MAQPINATLITNPVRPNDLNDPIPSALAIDIQGGHHSYETISERDSIIEARRSWGMLCTVFNDTDPTKNGTYQLVYNASSTTITDNLNWVVFSGSPQSISVSGEWLPSALSIVDTPPIGMTNGERFLITSPSFAGFATQSYRVAEWNSSALSGSGDWVYTTPTNGATIRVDNIANAIYKFSGTWSEGGFWQKEYLSQIRYIQPTSTDGTTYSFTTSSDLVALDAYSYSVYYANFGFTNSGASTLEIDGLGYYPVKKLNGGSLIDLGSQDLVPNVQYHMSWNIDNFLIHNLGGGGSVSLTIGPAEDGTYEDGLFTDFTYSTPIGVPIDRFNEILLALVPPPAPDLDVWSLGGPSFVGGKLSFDSSIAGLSASPTVGINGDFNPNSPNIYRKGINSFVTQPKTGTTYYADYTGILNFGVPEGPGDPTPAYAENAFGNGITGSLVLKLNGATISNESLANKSAINTTSGGGQSGLIISAATSSKFPSGVPFEFFWHRTGSFLIKKTDTNLRQGFNYLDLSHILPSQTLTLASYSWVSDPSDVATSFSSPALGSIVGSNPKILSGIRYWKNLSLTYTITLQNHVKNTYNSSSSALVSSSTVPGGGNGINAKTTTTTVPIMGPPTDKVIPSVSAPSTSHTIVWSYSLNSNVRRLNESVSFSTSVLRTVQGTDPSSSTTLTNVFVDNYPETSALLTENFLTESFRLRNGSSQYDTSMDTVQTVLNNFTWESNRSLYNSSGFDNGLQILNGQLVYPKFNYDAPGTADTNPNKGLGTPVRYDLCNTLTTGFGGTSYRTFTRYFRVDASSNFAILKFDFGLSDTNFVNANITLSGNNCWCEVKLPKDTTRPSLPPGTSLIGGAVTGWLDMTKKAFDGQSNDGNGAYRGSPSFTNPTSIEVDFRAGRSTFFSNGYVLLRITAPSSWTGHISSIVCSGLTI